MRAHNLQTVTTSCKSWLPEINYHEIMLKSKDSFNVRKNKADAIFGVAKDRPQRKGADTNDVIQNRGFL
ncbi:unnamed protein product [Allacma fusca]|uniref:Uncharacterized protein n=1 Tax=Allacma fusca TaxID=39272 RepID=A0A8J2KQV2_9HEXA|nr:unnamed protein product [Allacma fusca]